MNKKITLVIIGLLSVLPAFTQTNAIEVRDTGEIVMTTTNLIVNGVEYSAIPEGAIIMWSGTQVPNGWGLCDGSTYDGTKGSIVSPNLIGRFIVGYDSAAIPNAAYAKVGNAGGSETVTLSENQMPSHTHEIISDGAHIHSLTVYRADFSHAGDATESCVEDDGDGTFQIETNAGGGHSHALSYKGQGAPVPNLPPYYTLAYIIKIKGQGSNTTIRK